MKKRNLLTLAIVLTLAAALGLQAGCSPAPENEPPLADELLEGEGEDFGGQEGELPAIIGANIKDGAPAGTVEFEITTNEAAGTVSVWQGDDAPIMQEDFLTHEGNRIWSFSYDVSSVEGDYVQMNVAADNVLGRANLTLAIPLTGGSEGNEGMAYREDDPPPADSSTPSDSSDSGSGGGSAGQQGKEPIIYDFEITKHVYAPGGTIEFNVITDNEAVSVDVWKGDDAHTRQFDYKESGSKRTWAFKYNLKGNAGDAIKMNVIANNAVGAASWVFTMYIEEEGGQKGEAPHIFSVDQVSSVNAPGGTLIFKVKTDLDTATVDALIDNDNRTRQTESKTEGNTKVWSFTYEISGNSGDSVLVTAEANNVIGSDSMSFYAPIN